MIDLNLPSVEVARAVINKKHPRDAEVINRNGPAFVYAIYLIEIQDDPVVAAQVVPLAVDYLEKTDPFKAFFFRLAVQLGQDCMADIAECVAIWLDNVYLPTRH